MTKISIRKIRKYIFVALSSLVFVLCFIGKFFSNDVQAQERQKVRVAFFPLEGFNVIEEDGSYSGMDVEYLEEVCEYTNWEIEYVVCEDWAEALELLKEQKVDLVGSAQHSEERAEIYDYAYLSSGYTFGVIATNPDGVIAYEDFEVMKDIVFGVEKNYVRKAEFLRYLSDHEITEPNVIEYESVKELKEALHKGEIDAMVHTLMEIEEGQRLIGRFAPRPIYYITYKGNSELMLQLNRAIADIKMNNPELESELLERYYQNKLDKTILFTTEEKQYLSEKKELVVGYQDSYYPFSYEENGQFEGLAKELLQESAQKAGLEIVYRKISSHEEAEEALIQGEIDILAYCVHKEENEELVQLDEYAQIPLVLVMDEEDSIDSLKTISVAEELASAVQEILKVEASDITICETQGEAISLVDTGKVDATICDGYLVEHLLRTNMQYNNLKITGVLNSEHPVYMVICKQKDGMLETILQKLLYELDNQTINDYMLQENVYPLLSFSMFIKSNSFFIIFALILIAGIIVAVSINMVKKSQEIQKLMYKDTDMNIWNLNYLIYMGEQKLLPERNLQYAIVVVNIVRLRQYNIVYGWSAGEKLLKIVKKALVKCVGEDEICARGHGNRFALLLGWTDWEEFLERLKQIQLIVEDAIYKETENRMMIQMGVYPIGEDEKDVKLAVNYANQALEVIVNQNNREIRVYDAPFEAMIRERHERERMLETIDIEQNFVAYYQSKVDIRTKKIVGAEALVRFLDPQTEGMVRPPAYFVPYYEQTGRIVEIDFFVLEEVCKMLRRRLDAGKSVVPISCNFSRMHFTKNGFPERFEQIMSKYQVPKKLIEVEITETIVVEELQQQKIKETLEMLREKDVQLSIDDFGAGYSSLGVFEQIPASVVKLDRSFMINHKDYVRQVKIMRGIVKLTEEMDAKIVCEGVETEEDVELMKEVQAYVAQGYYFSKPIPEAEFEELLDQNE